VDGRCASWFCETSENLAVNEAILHLKDGQSRPVCMPVGRELHDLLHFMRTPADAAGKSLRLQAPAGAAMEIAAKDIASLEVPPPHALIPDFMTDAELAQVLAFTLAHADTFQNSGTYQEHTQGDSTTGDLTTGRRSRILDGPANGAMAALIMPKLQALMPQIWSRLRMDPLPLSSLECQITAHGDGDFFATHTDNDPPEIAYRRISYVYYFHRAPKQFIGGHLCLYHTLFHGGGATCGRLAVDIDPPRNGLMIFPTFVFHKVSQIGCASSALADQRLTLNGWLF
jgi:Rps23 Pro-64 3,4-dihydroxylase Tpa1-like proline 4-hydroxylase